MPPKKRTRATATIEDGVEALGPFITKQQFMLYDEEATGKQNTDTLIRHKALIQTMEQLSNKPFTNKLVQSVLMAVHKEKKQKQKRLGSRGQQSGIVGQPLGKTVATSASSCGTGKAE